MTDDDIVYPITGNEDLIAAGLFPERDNDVRDAAATLFGVDVSSGPAPIDLDGGDAGAAATATGTAVASNTNSTDDNGTPTFSSVGKCKSAVWADFELIYEEVNGNKIQTTTICRMCKAVLSARSTAGTGHLIRHQKSCRKKVDHAARIQSRLAFNSDGSIHNWNYNPTVARSELCH